jgi:hypothetical protein
MVNIPHCVLLNIQLVNTYTNRFQCVATLICLLIEDVKTLIDIGVLSEYLFVAMSIVALLYLRKVSPDAHRPIKVNGPQLSPILNSSLSSFIGRKGQLVLPGNISVVLHIHNSAVDLSAAIRRGHLHGDHCSGHTGLLPWR